MRPTPRHFYNCIIFSLSNVDQNSSVGANPIIQLLRAAAPQLDKIGEG